MCIICIYSYKEENKIKEKVKKIVEEKNKKIKVIRLYYLNPNKYKILENLKKNNLLNKNCNIEIYNNNGEYIYKIINEFTYKKNKLEETYISFILKEINLDYKYKKQHITYFLLSFFCSLQLNNNKQKCNEVIIDDNTEFNYVLKNLSISFKNELNKININLI